MLPAQSSQAIMVVPSAAPCPKTCLAVAWDPRDAGTLVFAERTDRVWVVDVEAEVGGGGGGGEAVEPLIACLTVPEMEEEERARWAEMGRGDATGVVKRPRRIHGMVVSER